MPEVQIEPSWKAVLEKEFEQPYWGRLTDFVRSEYATKKIYPPAKKIFHAFDACPFESVKVVILGQDPYHGPNQAQGLSFAVAEGMQLPPSLQNIYKELRSDVQIEPLPSGDLSRWAEQGVLLLNSVLTVVAGTPASHAHKGWENFTDAVLRELNARRSGIVYLLWGKYAQNKGSIIDHQKNLVLSSGHPSPFSAHLFHGNHHFSSANTYLQLQGKEAVNWQ